MRISDWSSDVCSSDLALDDPAAALRHLEGDALGGIDASAHADDAVAERREVVGQRVSGPPRELVFLADRAHERVVALQALGWNAKLRTPNEGDHHKDDLALGLTPATPGPPPGSQHRTHSLSPPTTTAVPP